MIKTCQSIIYCIILATCLKINTNAQDIIYFPPEDPLVQEKLEKWQDLKFGFMMHWGIYSQWGIVESWALCSEDWCTPFRDGADYIQFKEDYKNLKTTFNPVNFNPNKWAEAAKKAGMKYVVFTTKHHDGFSMFDSKYTDFKVTDPECPFYSHPKANIAKEIFDTFRDEGFLIGAYFSKPDWNHPDYWSPEWATPNRCNNYDIRKYPAKWERFKEFTYNQIDEITSDYGRIDILWLDGGWVRPDSTISQEVINWGYQIPEWEQDIDMPNIVANARRNQPGLLLVDRTVHGPYENYLTPEQRIPDEMIPFPWETCMTMSGSWSYTFNPDYKTSFTIITNLVDIVAKGGNYLLNVGPGPDGEIDEIAFQRMEEIGEWMDTNGEAIYESRPLTPYREGNFAFLKNKDDKAKYLVYMPSSPEDPLPQQFMIYNFKLHKKQKVDLLGHRINPTWEQDGPNVILTLPSRIAPTKDFMKILVFKFYPI